MHSKKNNKAKYSYLFLHFICCIFFFLWPGSISLLAQNPFTDTVRSQTSTSLNEIYIVQAQRLNYQKIDSIEYQSAAGKVVIRQNNTLFYCDSVVLNKKLNQMQAFGHVHINDADSIHTYADFLRYNGNEKKAFLDKNVKLSDGNSTLTTKSLTYDVSTKLGTYKTPGKVVNGKTVLTSNEGFYYGDTKDIYFKKKVELTDPDYILKTDTLLYNTQTGIATFVAPTEILSGSRKVLTNAGYYDAKARKTYFGQRPHIEDSTTVLDANEIAFDDSSGYSEASGNVVYKDTAQGITILANNLKSNKKTESFLATEKPILILRQDKDSVFLAADTFFSAKLSALKNVRDVPVIRDSLAQIDSVKRRKGNDSTDRFIEAYFHVRIFSDSLQAVGDSLFYSMEDSVFRLFKNPVVWGQESQITGDTIYLYTSRQKPKEMYVFENAISIQKTKQNFYNQVSGRTIKGLFDTSGNLDMVRAKGNAASIYYAQDDVGKYVGVNRATADMIDMFFTNKEADKVVFRRNLEGISYPMGQVNHETLRLDGFNWLEWRRPKTKYDLFIDEIKGAPDIPVPPDDNHAQQDSIRKEIKE
jgi:lipopolysaccharide export system protein LptA